ncbi:hypothetical protein A9K55_008221 [Cordyceps militaris]|uniref:Uncharacterized protein n=1 Tax=Cordyceps militaris TaxID=73501 RepID=A0A2H4SFW8_CORMI|nr:hypothetical protein A9K55_008221 [Cordyceps militaris]
MESRDADTDPTQEPRREDTTAGGNARKDGKGKDREVALSDRLRASGRMALNAAATGQPSLSPTGSSSGKASSGNQNESSIPGSVLAEASHHHAAPGLGDSVRNHPQGLGQASTQYDEFVNTAPQMQDSFHSTLQSDESMQSASFREQTAADGADVAQLLAMPEEEPRYLEFDNLLSEHEAARLREALFANSPSQPVWNHLLNFNPEFVLNPRNSHQARSHTGTEDTMVAQEIWLQQWQEVLSSYTDAVWGDLGSLAEEARHEIEALKSHADTRSPESKALGRLRQILAHYQRPPSTAPRRCCGLVPGAPPTHIIALRHSAQLSMISAAKMDRYALRIPIITQPAALKDSANLAPHSAVCTGTAPATAPTAPAGSPSYVLNSYFPFPYASTTFGNSAACSSAVQSCSRNYDACLTKLQNGNGYHVTVAVPGDTGTTVTGGGGSFPGSQATYICSSLSLVACEAVGSATCTSFGQDSGTCNVTPASSSWLLLLLLAINLTW